jgi:hypothetical protein
MRTLKLICWFTFLSAFSFAGNPSLESLLKELDAVVENKHSYDVAKEAEIAGLKERLLHSTDAKEQFDLYQDLFDTYLHYQADSALNCVERKETLFPCFFLYFLMKSGKNPRFFIILWVFSSELALIHSYSRQ